MLASKASFHVGVVSLIYSFQLVSNQKLLHSSHDMPKPSKLNFFNFLKCIICLIHMFMQLYFFISSNVEICAERLRYCISVTNNLFLDTTPKFSAP